MKLGKTMFKLLGACKSSTTKSNYSAYRQVDTVVNGTEVSDKIITIAVETTEYLAVLQSDYEQVKTSEQLRGAALSNKVVKTTWSEARVATAKDPLLEEDGYAVKMKTVLDTVDMGKLSLRLEELAQAKIAAATSTAKAVDPMVLLEALAKDPNYRAAMELLLQK